MPHASPGSALTEAVAVKSQKRGSTREKVPFPQKLVLHRWLLALFGVKSVSELGKDLRSETLEGLDENNIHRFHNALKERFSALEELPVQLLREYDENIVRHTQRLNEWRIAHGRDPFVWKYLQYLALLFTTLPSGTVHTASDRAPQ